MWYKWGTTMQEAQEDQSDFMESLGLETRPNSPEEALMEYLTEGNYKRIHTIRFWLMHEMARFQDLKKNEVNLTKEKFSQIKQEVINYPLTNKEYATLSVNYHLRSNYYGWFMDTANRKKCDL